LDPGSRTQKTCSLKSDDIYRDEGDKNQKQEIGNFFVYFYLSHSSILSLLKNIYFTFLLARNREHRDRFAQLTARDTRKCCMLYFFRSMILNFELLIGSYSSFFPSHGRSVEGTRSVFRRPLFPRLSVPGLRVRSTSLRRGFGSLRRSFLPFGCLSFFSAAIIVFRQRVNDTLYLI